jgi:hypothetical protein
LLKNGTRHGLIGSPPAFRGTRASVAWRLTYEDFWQSCGQLYGARVAAARTKTRGYAGPLSADHPLAVFDYRDFQKAGKASARGSSAQCKAATGPEASRVRTRRVGHDRGGVVTPRRFKRAHDWAKPGADPRQTRGPQPAWTADGEGAFVIDSIICSPRGSSSMSDSPHRQKTTAVPARRLPPPSGGASRASSLIALGWRSHSALAGAINATDRPMRRIRITTKQRRTPTREQQQRNVGYRPAWHVPQNGTPRA